MTKTTILRTIVAAIAAIAATACTKTTVSTKSDDGSYIHFSTAVSRAAVVDISGVNQFGVWLYNDSSPVLENERVYLAGGSWVYDNLQKWTDGKHAFGAFYPYGLTQDIIKVQPDVNKETGEIEDFKIDHYDGSKAEHDLMTAVSTREFDSANPDTSPVSLTFNHLLSRIRVEAVCGSGEVTLNSVEFFGMRVYGTYNYEADDSWVLMPVGESTPLGKFTASDLTVTPDAAVPVFKDDLLLIPQDVTSSITLKVNYTTGGEKPVKTFTLPETTDWEMGKSYRYTLKFNMEDVGLSVSIADWNVIDTSVEW